MPDAENVVQEVIDETARKTANETTQAVAATVAANEAVKEGTVSAAETAVALANGTAAAAKQQAVERESLFYEGVNKWQTEQQSRMEKQEAELAATRAEISGIASAISSLAQQLSTPPKSGETVTTTTVDPETGATKTVQEEVAPEGQKPAPKKPRVRFI